MARLTEEMVIARSKQSDLTAIKKLNCWGAELGDVSLLRRMPNVEVLAFSINKIRGLGDFAGCRRLRELYVRKNEISDLHEIRHLRHLPDLTSLWLDENPCTTHPQYRMTVLRNLPNLEKLDNVPVQPDEVAEAMRRGVHIPDSDDEGYPHQQESYGGYRQRSSESSPEREHEHEQEHETYYARHPPRHEGSDSSEAGGEAPPDTARSDLQCPASPVRRVPDCDERYEHPAMTRSHYDSRPSARSPDAGSLRHSLSAHSVKEYAYSSNGECRHAAGVASPPYHEPYYERADRSESFGHMSQRGSGEAWDERGGRDRGAPGTAAPACVAPACVAPGPVAPGPVAPGAGPERERDYPSAVMAEHRGFTRRPVARNSNLLSAVLCLVKELDYPSLEVAEMAVRCRMDELANSQ